ncbi:hypothetical protein KCU98_g703, partial [Aureobasidium melanogenum]
MGAEGRKSLKRITVLYKRSKHAWGPKEKEYFAELFRQCVSLRSLNFVFNIKHKQTNGHIEICGDEGYGQFTYKKVSHIPGLKALKMLFVPHKSSVLEITASPESESVQQVEKYMFGGV